MTNFELYTIIFLALDADWDDTHDEALGAFLSDANPFLFDGDVSAVRKVYDNFCEFIGDRKIDFENSFSIANEYIKNLDNDAVTESFELLEKEQWDDAVREYLNSEHKA